MQQNKGAKLNDEEAPILPDQIIMENILPRIPVKPLIRFKSVLRFWYSSLCSPEFAKSQLKLAPSSFKFLLFLYHITVRPPRRVVSLSFDERSSRVKELVNVEFGYNGQDVHVVGCCNGLVCLYDKLSRFCLWNPATRHYHYFDDHGERDNALLAVGFGYVSCIDDYRIACLLSSGHVVDVHIYCLSAARWDKMASSDKDGLKIAQKELPVMLGDTTLYWPPELIYRDNPKPPVVAVNLVNGELTKIPLMKYRKEQTPQKAKLFRKNGRLSIVIG